MLLLYFINQPAYAFEDDEVSPWEEIVTGADSNWTLEESNTTVTLSHMQFFDENNGWMMGSNNNVFKFSGTTTSIDGVLPDFHIIKHRDGGLGLLVNYYQDS